MYGFIYITENKVNKKKYLGMSRYGKRSQTTYLGSGKALKRAIKKYGRENFEVIIIDWAETKEALSALEVKYIERHGCVKSLNWYNIAVGGHTTKGFSGKKHSTKTKELMRKNYKRVLTPAGAKRIGDAVKSHKSYLKAAKARTLCVGEKHHASKKVVIGGVIYPSITEAHKSTGISRYLITKNFLSS